MKTSLVVLLGSILGFASACPDGPDGHDHRHAKRAPAPVIAPTRPLEWGDINILHTTDTHGWLLGHQKDSAPEPNYSGNFGDFASFVQHMKAEAKKRNVDLLLVDSGDIHDGTGLTDGFPPGGVDAHDANTIFSKLPYDVLAIGNHELYLYENALDIHQNFAPQWKGRYLSSNVNITVLDKNGANVSVPVGSPFAKFKTERGRSVTALGVLYDFTGNSANTTVQPVAKMVNETWFKEAIADAPDLFLLVGHMPIAKDKWPLVFNAIRAVHPTVPIVIFGGHTHIRDCNQLDARSMSLESGRYMETVGWLSAKLDNGGNVTFNRRYLDPNPLTYQFHTGLGSKKFATSKGKKITAALEALAQRFDLSSKFGTAPQDYFLSRAPFNSSQSLLNLFTNEVLPTALSINNTRASIPNIILSNSGSQRFDIYTGPFTKNDQLTVSPFTDAFLFLANIPLDVASKVLGQLNSHGASFKRGLTEEVVRELYNKGDVTLRFEQWLQDQWENSILEKRDASNLTLGYVTKDSCPGIGDDTAHTPLPFFSAPDFLGSKPPSQNASQVDLVFLDFIESSVIQVVNTLGVNVTKADVKSYSNLLTNQVFGVFAEAKWN